MLTNEYRKCSPPIEVSISKLDVNTYQMGSKFLCKKAISGIPKAAVATWKGDDGPYYLLRPPGPTRWRMQPMVRFTRVAFHLPYCIHIPTRSNSRGTIFVGRWETKQNFPDLATSGRADTGECLGMSIEVSILVASWMMSTWISVALQKIYFSRLILRRFWAMSSSTKKSDSLNLAKTWHAIDDRILKHLCESMTH